MLIRRRLAGLMLAEMLVAMLLEMPAEMLAK
jgi:hypothetical protein